MNIGTKILALRLERKISLEDMAEKLGVTPTCLANIESGCVERTAYILILYIAAAFNIPAGSLIEGTDQEDMYDVGVKYGKFFAYCDNIECSETVFPLYEKDGEMNLFCTRCGGRLRSACSCGSKLLRDDIKFCSKCGKAIKMTKEAAPDGKEKS